ncbi:MAG: MFS transporter [Pseudomonadales bacterium]
MLALIVAAEAVYALPFHVARFFRPTLLEVFQLSATELGVAQGAYGVVAMLAYFPGGPLADRFPARKLLAWSLWTTALGGLYMATFPGYQGMLAVFGFFGLTTILLFWAALIRATREWGDAQTQGRAYGLLDGGRGVLAALMASGGVALVRWVLPDGAAAASDAQQADALRLVIHGYTVVTALAGCVVWFALTEPAAGHAPHIGPARRRLAQVLALPGVWLQAGVVVCAYVSFKGLDNYALLAVQVWGMDPVDAAGMMATASWLRPVAALATGLLADRLGVSRMLGVSFALLFACQLHLATAVPDVTAWLLANVLVTSTCVFGLRGIYFALLEATRVPSSATGVAVGVVSVVGYTPDVFVMLIAGLLIDRSPGVVGHQQFLMLLAVFSVLGCLLSVVLARIELRAKAHAAGSGAKPVS